MRAVTRVLVLLLVTGSTLLFAQTNPHVGTWQLNPAKSKFDPGPAPKSQTRVYEMSGDMFKSTQTNILPDGIKSVGTYSARFDGKDYPATGSPVYDTIALTRVDANTFEATLKRSGKVVQTARNVVSPDGKMMTVTVNGSDLTMGRQFTTVIVLDKH